MCRSQVLPTIVATGRERLGEDPQRDILVGASATAAGHAERRDLRPRRRVGLERAEQLGVLRIRLREARLDEREAHSIDQVGESNLLTDRERDALALRAVAERRVIDANVEHHTKVYGAASSNTQSSRSASRLTAPGTRTNPHLPATRCDARLPGSA